MNNHQQPDDVYRDLFSKAIGRARAELFSDGPLGRTSLPSGLVVASLKWATAKVERSAQRDNGERSSGRERQAERGGDFNDMPPTY